MKLTRITAIILALLGVAAAIYMAVSYYYLSPPLPLSNPRSDSMGNVHGSIYYFFPATLTYVFLVWRYTKNAFRVAWYYRVGSALLAWAVFGGALLLAIHRGEVEALFVVYTGIVAIVCTLLAIVLLFTAKRAA